MRELLGVVDGSGTARCTVSCRSTTQPSLPRGGWAGMTRPCSLSVDYHFSSGRLRRAPRDDDKRSAAARRRRGGGSRSVRPPAPAAASAPPRRRGRLNPAARGRGADETAQARGGAGGRRPTVCLRTIGAAPSVREGDDRYTEAVRVPAGYQVVGYSCVIFVSCVWSYGDLMNYLFILPSLFCRRHHFRQTQSRPVGVVVHRLSSLPSLPASPWHVTQRNIVLQAWVPCDMTEVP